MTASPESAPPHSHAPRPIIGPGTIIIAGILMIIVGTGYCASRITRGILPPNETRVTHDLVVQEMRAVAKLVSSETTVRDVIVYENTWYGSTKRSLVVVTGKLLAGIDLADSADVKIDGKSKRITIRIPAAKLIGVEVVDMRTYDERGGLWNPFRSSDRDAIQRQVRAQLVATGQQMQLLRHANESAVLMLRTLLAKDGYTVDVSIKGTPTGPFVD
jgi:hypothetical protein